MTEQSNVITIDGKEYNDRRLISRPELILSIR